MLLSICCVPVRHILQLVVLRFRSGEFKELEIVVLRHQLARSVPRLGRRRSGLAVI